MNATPQALDQLKKALNSEENPLAGIRVSAQQGCCGPALQMAVTEKASTGDNLITIESVNFFIFPQAEELIEGVTVDYGPDGFKLLGMKKSGGCC
ncbi:MAG: iron-sulfur cluster biosynthesis family protein [Bacteroidota bacterium]